MSSKKQKHYKLKVFFTTAFVSFMLMVLGIGFIIVDYNTRNIGLGDGSLRFDVYVQNSNLNINVLGREKSIDFPKSVSSWAGRVWNMLPPGVRTVFWIFEGEYDAVPELIENAGK